MVVYDCVPSLTTRKFAQNLSQRLSVSGASRFWSTWDLPSLNKHLSFEIQTNKQQCQEVSKKWTREMNLVPVLNLNEANPLLEVALMSQERILDPLSEVWLNLVLPFISFLVSQTCLSLDQRMKMRRGRREWNRSIDASLLGFRGNCSRRWWCERHETTERNERLPNALWRSEVHSKI